MSPLLDLALLPDVERLVSRFLREHPRVAPLVAGERVWTAVPASAGAEPFVLLQRVGGDPVFSYPLVLDVAQVQVACYGGPKVQAWTLAATAQAALAELTGEVRDEGIVANVELRGLRYLPDEAYSPARPRYLFDAYFHARSGSPGSASRSATSADRAPLSLRGG